MSLLEFFLAAENAFFVFCVGFILLIFVLELAGAVTGFSILGLDDGIDVDGLDLDSGDFNPLSWLSFGKVPIIVCLLSLCLSISVVGYAIQALVYLLSDELASLLVVSLCSMMPAFAINRKVVRLIAAILPSDETYVVSTNSFINEVAVVMTGTAVKGRPAEAKVYDKFGRAHFVMVEPSDDQELPAGTEVILLSRNEHLFTCARALSENRPVFIKPSPNA
ncbi:OB-fold-containig protein [Thalassospira xiamenensis]|uniref:DUF1449 family protein n=1 Tax=Thalassospira xiamenensis TaxID=220697 RepID=A0A285TI29_9PROT|nr:OB-fold-containig protein [Thalassospira xiamenensis]SOC21634.1 Protein of unknown function [Thalassospira xiamenensis]